MTQAEAAAAPPDFLRPRKRVRGGARPRRLPLPGGGSMTGAAFGLIAILFALLLGGEAAAQSIALDLGEEDGAGFTARIFQLILFITVLSLAPAILVTMTSFVRIVVVLAMLRSALGLQQTPPNMVLISLALFLTAYVMGPTLGQVWAEGVQPMMDEQITAEQGLERMTVPMKRFMLAQTREKDLKLFADLDGTAEERAKAAAATAPTGFMGAIDRAGGDELPSLRVLVPAFLISELRRAFEIGFLIFLPFLVIDLVVAALLMSMGMMMLPPAIVSLPFKVIFFVLIEGWYLLAVSLVKSFA